MGTAAGGVTLQAVRSCAVQEGYGVAAQLRALLRRGVPPVPADAPAMDCPMDFLASAYTFQHLRQAELAYDAWCLDNAYQLEEWDRQAAAAQASGSDDEWHDGSQGEEGGSGGEESGGSGDEEEEGGGDGGEDRAAWLQRRQRQLNDDMGAAMDAVHQEFLERMDVLAEAGYRPREDPHDVWLRRAARREPWSPATHADFPPAYRRAARALLLAARRHKGLGSLPQGALQHVLGLAAYPLSAWRPCEK